jgi:hypothetical protein
MLWDHTGELEPLFGRLQFMLGNTIQGVNSTLLPNEHIMIFRLYCDESHDSTNEKKRQGGMPFESKSYVVGGFMSDQDSWGKIESRWKRKNELEGVRRYHAAHLNAGTWEYEGWTKSRRIRYSKEMLRILKNRGRKLHGMSCGLHVDAYRKVISQEGQIKMGHPYLVCFKALIATVAKQMDEGYFPYEDRFAVIVDRGDHDFDAVRVFDAIKGDPQFPHRHRLESCTSASSEALIGLQPADFVAYETFRLMHDKRKGQTEIRAALKTMLGSTAFFGYLLDETVMVRMKDAVDKATCNPDGLVIVPPNLDAR